MCSFITTLMQWQATYMKYFYDQQQDRDIKKCRNVIHVWLRKKELLLVVEQLLKITLVGLITFDAIR